MQEQGVTERKLAELWKEIFQTEAMPRATDNFFGLGGDSIGMITLLFRITEEFGVELPPDAMFGAQTFGELSCLVESARLSTASVGLISDKPGCG